MPSAKVIKKSLYSPSFILLTATNLLIFSSIFAILSTLPLYLNQELAINPITSGIILAIYTVTGLCFRPFAGYLADSYKSKKFYIFALFLFTLCMSAYNIQGGAFFLFMLRLIHGVAFSLVTSVGATCVIAILPREKLGTGLGIFGISSSLAMALGPSLAYAVLERGDYSDVFILTTATALCALLVSFLIPSLPTEKVQKIELNFRNLFLPQIKKPFIAFLGTIFPYALLLVYVQLLFKEKLMEGNLGHIFISIAAGLTISRLFSGRFIDGGRLKQITVLMSIISIAAYFAFYISASMSVFLVAAFFVGLGCGTLTPAYQTIFTTLAPPQQRGRASSLFFAAFDLGGGIAMLGGGVISHFTHISVAFLLGSFLLTLSLIYFLLQVWPFYLKNNIKNE